MKKTLVGYSVGKQVGVRLAGRVLAAVVIEDRGDLGPGGGTSGSRGSEADEGRG
jgi:hypothetical protein